VGMLKADGSISLVHNVDNDAQLWEPAEEPVPAESQAGNRVGPDVADGDSAKAEDVPEGLLGVDMDDLEGGLNTLKVRFGTHDLPLGSDRINQTTQPTSQTPYHGSSAVRK